MALSNLKAPSFRYVQAAILGLPFVERRAADPVLAANVHVFEPASCSRRIAMIRSSVNLDCFISVSLQVTNSADFLDEIQGLRSRRTIAENKGEPIKGHPKHRSSLRQCTVGIDNRTIQAISLMERPSCLQHDYLPTIELHGRYGATVYI